MLPSRFVLCDVTNAKLFLIFLDVLHFWGHLVIMGFMQISAETREVIVYPCNEGTSQRFIVEETGTFCKSVQRVFKRWRGQES